MIGGWRLSGGRRLALDPFVVMGVVNLTPDSFSDGGELDDLDAALRRAEQLVEAGAGVLDVGGESTRPGATTVDAAQELDRILPFVRAAAERLDVPLSVDTRKASVAEAALSAGASIVNDVSGLVHDPALGAVVAAHGAGFVLMHMRGSPADMADHAGYDDLMTDVARELAEAVSRAEAAGVGRDAIVVDPGIGFAKSAEQSLELIGRLGELADLGLPLLVGPSRKSFLGHVLGVPARERVAGTVASCVLAYLGGARLFRVHDVRPVVQALTVVVAVAEAVRTSAPAGIR